MRIALALVIAVGCGGEKKAAPEKNNRKQETGDRKQETGDGEARQAAKGLEKAEVEGLVEKWKGAQNQGDFAGYQALYARRMTGIKRVGARVFRFDREGWMKDRGRMFKKKMEVAADTVEVSPAGGSALVRLEQTFKQGSFQDVGPKQLVVVREEGGLRIAREEMMASTVVAAAAAAAGGALDDVYLILDGEVLLDPIGGASEKGKPSLVKESGSASFRARAAIDRKSIDSPLAQLVAKKLTLYRQDGTSCQASLEPLSLVAGLTPHFGTAAVWRGEDGSTPLSEAEIAAEIWSGGGTVLVGGTGTCNGLIARAGGAPVVAFEVVKDDAQAARALAAFRKLPGWHATQKTFVETGGTGDWDKGDVPSTITLYRHPTSKKTWAVVRATGGNPCSEFGAEMTAVLEQVGSSWKDRSAPNLAPFSPEGAFDLDGDGAPEILGPLSLIDDAGDGFDTVREFRYPDHDCPC